MNATDPARSGLEPVGDGAMWLDRDYQPPLEQAGLLNFDAVMATSEGRCMRALVDRENWRLDLHVGCSRPRGMFLKKHHVRSLWSRFRARLGNGPGATPGRVEAENVRRLTAEGIDVMRLVAYGEKLHPNGLLESFVITEELAGFTPLDEFLRRRFPDQQAESGRRRDRDLDRLIRQVADVTRRFHAAGYNHRDLYCCHFFIKEPRPGEFEIRMIDLQRVQHRQRFRRRWLVKDLAQLAWSLPWDRIKCTQRLAFIRYYLGIERLRPRDKRLIRQILAKQQFMARKLGVA
jgi:hypothetical protein